MTNQESKMQEMASALWRVVLAGGLFLALGPAVAHAKSAQAMPSGTIDQPVIISSTPVASSMIIFFKVADKTHGTVGKQGALVQIVSVSGGIIRPTSKLTDSNGWTSFYPAFGGVPIGSFANVRACASVASLGLGNKCKNLAVQRANTPSFGGEIDFYYIQRSSGTPAFWLMP